MWSLPLQQIESCLGTLPRTAIETGTCRGNGTRILARRFKRVITIELSEKLYRIASERLSGPGYAHVELLHGDSGERLKEALGSLTDGEPVFIYLDAHWSGDRSVDWTAASWKGYGIDTAHLGPPGSTPTGPQQCPLARELSAVMEFCAGPAYILIDDLKNLPAAGPGLKDHEFPGEDWSHLTRQSLLSIVAPRLQWTKELDDPPQWLFSLAARTNSAP